APEESTVLRDIMSATGTMITLAILLALLIGAVLVTIFDPTVRYTVTYFFGRPGDTFVSIWMAFSGFFTSLFKGAIFDYDAATFARAIRPLTETLTNSIPLILAGLAVGVGFRGGLFNIGGPGQIIVGAITATYVGFAVDLPPGLHLLVAVLAAMVAGALWASIAGVLKAKANANEVIVTIMLNSIALFLLAYVLKTRVFIGDGYAGKSLDIAPGAGFAPLFGSQFRLHWGFVLALLAAAAVWWILERSTFGFELKAVGANQAAARTAGMSVTKVIILTMVLSGALAGLAATGPALGTERFLTDGIAANYGYDAITVALLGRSRPLGTVLAGILFGALNAGGSLMQAAAAIPIDIVQVAQAIIVLLIAAPPLVRLIFHLPTPRDKRVAPSVAPARAEEGASA
ncbi:MAG: ABC transporter permease, partial [Humibacillus sp.]|nr:ABC transporter permease [Humibacillus sp.]